MSTFYGIGIGPGDPELITVKALRIIRCCDVILVPGENPGDSVAYKIAAAAEETMSQKEIYGIPMPMTKDARQLKQSHEWGADLVIRFLKQNKNTAFLTLGDPSIYSTYVYLQKLVAARGYDCEMIPGIPSFCAAAARMGMSLAEQAEEIHILPASYQIEEGIKLSGTRILMKAGKKMKEIKEKLLQSGQQAYLAENCGMPGERIIQGAENFPDETGYYALIVLRD